MLIKRTRGWEIPERLATSEGVYLRRRELVAAMGLGAMTLALPGAALAQNNKETDPSAGRYPAPRNDKFGAPSPITAERLATTYNNYYEFGTDKSIWRDAQKLPLRPWTIKVGGLVEKPFEIGFDDLLARMQLEERVYRHRCVEAWSMVIPWNGIPLANFIKRMEPTGKAKFIKFTTANDTKQMPGLRSDVLDWPYVEGLRMDEAMHPLTILVVGLYGEMLPNQDGAPLRLAVPWKYGFKHVKSINKIEFLEKQPVNTWQRQAPNEYGFYANVNPAVDHPRWSQATERRIGEFFKRKTLMFNGYGDQVASMYSALDLKKNF
jgi:sulfoxide reductase catalytic subunit YedY